MNAIAFASRNAYAFATGGSDGNIVMWDKDGKNRLTVLDKFEKQTTISALTFNPMNNLLFYAHSYEWSMGQHSPLVQSRNEIWIHPVDPSEITRKSKWCIKIVYRALFFLLADTQASFVTPEVRGQDVSSEHESLDNNDVECNTDFYIFNHKVAES